MAPMLVAGRPPEFDPAASSEAEEVSGLRLVDKNDDQSSGLLAGKYRLEGVMAEGGVGIVYRAWHIELERHVAIKMLRAKYRRNLDAKARLHREAQAMAQLRGNHSARVMDVGSMTDGTAFIVLELLEGTDLRQLLRETGRLSVADTIDFMRQAARGLAEAHAHGLIHCDLKPDNLFLATQTGEAAVIKLIDFGIARSFTSSTESAHPHGCVGSPQYMSPEQFTQETVVDTRTDIWSLGVAFYELATGELPFKGDTLLSLCTSVVQDEPISPRQLRADLPEALERVILCCLAKQRDARYPSMLALMDDLLLVDAMKTSSCSSSLRTVVSAPAELPRAFDTSKRHVRRAKRGLVTVGAVLGICAVAYLATVNQVIAFPGISGLDSPAAHSNAVRSPRMLEPAATSRTPAPSPNVAAVQFAELAEVREQELSQNLAPASKASWHVTESGRDSSGVRRVTGLRRGKPPTSVGTSDNALEERYGLSYRPD